MSIELKIKAKHLSLEPSIIRCEERRLKKQIKFLKKSLKDTAALSNKLNSLNMHRRNEVRNESRATHLARTFLAGKPYSYAEQKRKQDRESLFQSRIIPRIVAMIKKYGNSDQINASEQSISKWSELTKVGA